MIDNNKNITKTVPSIFQYLGQETEGGEIFMTELPTNYILDKGKTGCGGTELAIRNSKPTIIAMPYVSLIKNKQAQHPDRLLGVYNGVTKQDILDYIETHEEIKIAVTYDSLNRVVECLLENDVCDVFGDLFLLVDEYHVLFKDYIFRNRAVMSLLNIARQFENVTYMSATPLDDYFILEELKHLPRYTLEWENQEPTYITPIVTNKVQQKVVDTIKDALDGQILGNLHFFVNSVKFIKGVIEKAELKPEDVKIVCSKNEDEGVVLNRVKLGIDFEIAEALDAAKKINFYTSTAFEGCDIRDENGRTYIVSDPFIDHSMVDISTMFIQICGRIRNSFYKTEVTHIYSSTNYRYKDLNVSLEEYIETTEKDLHTSELWVTEINATQTKDITLKLLGKNKVLNDFYVRKHGSRFILDKNMMKLDIYNFKILKHIYFSSENLFEAYKANGLKKKATINGYYEEQEETEELLSDKLAKNPKTRNSFKDLFMEYSILRDGESLFRFGNRDERIVILENTNSLVKDAYDILGVEKVEELRYVQKKIREYLIKASNKTKDEQIIKLFLDKIPIHEEITVKKTNEALTEIYELLEIKNAKGEIKKAKSTDLDEWFNLDRTAPKIDGKTTECIIITRVKVFYVK